MSLETLSVCLNQVLLSRWKMYVICSHLTNIGSYSRPNKHLDFRLQCGSILWVHATDDWGLWGNSPLSSACLPQPLTGGISAFSLSFLCLLWGFFFCFCFFLHCCFNFVFCNWSIAHWFPKCQLCALLKMSNLENKAAVVCLLIA